MVQFPPESVVVLLGIPKVPDTPEITDYHAGTITHGPDQGVYSILDKSHENVGFILPCLFKPRHSQAGDNE